MRQEPRDIESRLAVWEAVEAIKRLKANYFWLMDHKLWDQFATLFTDDVHFYISGKLRCDKRDDFVAFVSKSLAEPTRSVHQGHMPHIEMIDADNAQGRWLLHDRITWPEGRVLEGYGYYLEEYTRSADGRWRIRSSNLNYFK